MIKAVIFDLGDVIVRNKVGERSRKLARHSTCSAPEISRGLFPRKMLWGFDEGRISSRLFFTRARKRFGLSLSYEKFKEYFSIFTLNRPVAELIGKLKGRYKLILLSNTNPLHFGYIRSHYPVIGLFDALILSYKVGSAKPGRRIYSEAIKQAKAKPEECVYIDDRKDYVDAAKALGIHCILYTSAKRLARDLDELKVKA